MAETSIHLFPRDFADVAQGAYSMAMHLAITHYPDGYKGKDAIEAVARANLTQVLAQVKTNDLQAFKKVFTYSFCSGYNDASRYCKEKPENYKEIMTLTSDEQIPLCNRLAHGWYTLVEKEIAPRVRVKPRLASRLKRKKHSR